MRKNDAELSFQQRNVLATLKDHAADIEGAIRSIESRAQHNFTVISIVLGVAAAVNLAPVTSPDMLAAIKGNGLYLATYLPSVYLLGAYCRTAYLSLHAMSVTKRGLLPILVTKEEIRRWERFTVNAYYRHTINAYIDIYQENKDIVASKAKSIKSAHEYIRNAVLAVAAQAIFAGVALFSLHA